MIEHVHIRGFRSAHDVALARDFEAVAELRGRRHRPEHALERFTVADREVPEQLADVVRRAVALARAA